MLRIIKDKDTKEEQKRIIKESKSLTLSELKKKLGKEYQNTYFINSENFKIEEEDESKFTIEEIYPNGLIFLQTKKKEIIIFYNDKEYDKIDYLLDLKLDELKKKYLNNIPSNAKFIDDSFEVFENDESTILGKRYFKR
jgi:hypothetical protein